MWGDVSSPRAGKRNVFSPRRSHEEKKSPRETSARSPRIVRRFLLLAIAKDSPREVLRSPRATDQDRESSVGSLGSPFSSRSSSFSLGYTARNWSPTIEIGCYRLTAAGDG
ncbi:hypothetical protein B296_00053434 [Ensete ventricosum]|uniref:Uncharacterized protein n=1 Tax=Ensete ventricosum TaxID=4639 RepID=A0A426X2J9_ENSVE|nr:hypothetical protein B296_00053434 [Ensete ventricosum]